MSYRYKVLSLKERGQLLLTMLIIILIGAIFFGTVYFVYRIFPESPSLSDSWLMSESNVSPGMAVFASLTMLCTVVAVTLLGTAIFSTLAFLYIPLFLTGLAGIALFCVSIFGAFADGGFWYGMSILGILAAEVGLITWILNKLIIWYDLRFGEKPYFSMAEGIFRGKNDPYLKDGIDKYL